MAKNFIIRCMNEKCNNYKQELNATAEICSLCNTPVTKIETKVNRKLQMIAVILAIAGPILFNWGLVPWMWWSGLVMSPASVVVGIISRSKAAIIVSILSLVINIGLFIYWFFLF